MSRTQRFLLYTFIFNFITFIIYYFTKNEYKKTRTHWMQPPRYVFFIIWPLLFTHMAYVLALADEYAEMYNDYNLVYGIYLLFIICCFWMLAVKNRKLSILIFIPLIAVALRLHLEAFKQTNWCFGGLLAWLIYALVLSSHIAENKVR